MRYKVIQTSYRSWIVEDNEGHEYIVTKQLTDHGYVWRCTCTYHSITLRICSHIRAVEMFLLKKEKLSDVKELVIDLDNIREVL